MEKQEHGPQRTGRFLRGGSFGHQKKTQRDSCKIGERGVHPKNHAYTIGMIQLCIALKLQSSASFRAVSKTIVILGMYMDLTTKAPSHSTILLWVKKYGHHELTSPKEVADDWVVILDESVQFGQSKLLVIYGIRQSKIDFSRPLKYQDLSPLLLMCRSSWDGEAIKAHLMVIQEQIGCIKYAVADHGNNIKKAIRLMGIPHVYDLTHRISLSLEHIYKEDAEFKGFTKRMASLRGAQALGKMAHVLPPAQRSKARFMNLRPISDWGMAILNLLDRPGNSFKAEKESLSWVESYRDLIQELAQLNRTINTIQSELKNNGLSKKTIAACASTLEEGKTDRLWQFKQTMNEYFQQTIESLKGIDRALCSSDILESSFGKYKNYLQANPMVGITNLCLSIPAFTGNLEREGLMAAFERTKVESIEKWTKSNIGETTLAKRLKVLKWGGNKI